MWISKISLHKQNFQDRQAHQEYQDREGHLVTMDIQGRWDQWENLERTVLGVWEECLGNTDGLVPEERTANPVYL